MGRINVNSPAQALRRVVLSLWRSQGRTDCFISVPHTADPLLGAVLMPESMGRVAGESSSTHTYFVYTGGTAPCRKVSTSPAM